MDVASSLSCVGPLHPLLEVLMEVKRVRVVEDSLYPTFLKTSTVGASCLIPRKLWVRYERAYKELVSIGQEVSAYLYLCRQDH